MEKVDYLIECKELFERKLRVKFGEPVGLTEAALLVLEERLEVSFPAAYRQYLLWMGMDKNGVLRGSEWFADDLSDNQDFLTELLAENEVTGASTGKKVCFFSHQGYMAAWFLADASELDPFCEFYSEADAHPSVKKVGRFSDFLLKELSGIVENIR